jgi:hypothetical protein
MVVRNTKTSIIDSLSEPIIACSYLYITICNSHIIAVNYSTANDNRSDETATPQSNIDITQVGISTKRANIS